MRGGEGGRPTHRPPAHGPPGQEVAADGPSAGTNGRLEKKRRWWGLPEPPQALPLASGTLPSVHVPWGCGVGWGRGQKESPSFSPCPW